MKFKVENLVKLYRTCTSSIPSSTGAFLSRTNENILSLQSYWSVLNLERAERSSFAINYSVGSTAESEDQLDINQIGFPTELGAETLSAVSSNGAYRATIRGFTDKKGEKKQILEIWSAKTKLKTFDLASFDTHGDVCEDGQFGGLMWSADCQKLSYIAERKKPKSESFFSQKKKTETAADESSTPTGAKTEKGIGHVYEEWGEQLIGRHNPAPFIFNLEEESVEGVCAISEEYSCGQAIWGPNDDTLVFVAWPNNPQRLGLIFCSNRPNKIYSFNVRTKELLVLYEDSKWSSVTPRLSPDGKCLVFLNNPLGGAHRNCSRLLKYDYGTNQTSIIVDTVETPKKSEFPGLFTYDLPVRCWATDNIHVLLSTSWKSKLELLSVNTNTGSTERLTNEDEYPTWNLMDIFENYVVVSRSSPSLRPHLLLSRYRTDEGVLKLGEWNHVEPIRDQVLPDIRWSIGSIQPEDTDDESMEYEYIILRPLDAPNKVPVIVYAHGGPHSVVSPGFVSLFHVFLKLGFSLVIVNYRGSLGYGETPLKSLLGKAGFQDVKDVQLAVERVLTKESWMDGTKVAVLGGSHGGFIATHLIGQYPEFYSACVCVNPVTDLRGKLEATDIPDWGWAEVGLADHASLSEYKSYAIVPPDLCREFWERSSVQYIPRVKTPVLMLLGKNDLRVPPTQGLNYYNALKAHGKVDAKIFVYEDNHSLSKVENHSDSVIRMSLFLAEKLGLGEETAQ